MKIILLCERFHGVLLENHLLFKMMPFKRVIILIFFCLVRIVSSK